MSFKRISILDSYKNRHILLTGTTGFLGKVLLSMMLDQLSNIGCIYVLIRKSKKLSAIDRFSHDILSSPIFTQLNAEKKTEFSCFLKRVKVIEGDLTLPDLGIAPALAGSLHTKIDLVINVAGLVDFSPDIRAALNINVHGALHVAEFVKKCRNARLIHISTCYVAGSRSGSFKEQVLVGQSPNGAFLDAEEELASITKDIEQRMAGTQTKMQGFKALGQERAHHWGWSNTYCYTKALAEFLLVTRYADIPLTIIRPSIIESAVSYPFPGWNEGVNGTAPLSVLIGAWYRCFTIKQKNIVDIVPVDYVSNAIIVIAADVLNNASSGVYQLASSSSNPCYAGHYVETSRVWHRHNLRKTAAGLPDYIRSIVRVKYVDPESKFAPQKLSASLGALDAYLSKKNINSKVFQGLNNKLTAFVKKLRRVDKIYGAFQPFTYDHVYIFSSERLAELSYEENKFHDEINTLDWNTYILNIHMPGLSRWIFPLLEKKKLPHHLSSISLSENEKTALLATSEEICP